MPLSCHWPLSVLKWHGSSKMQDGSRTRHFMCKAGSALQVPVQPQPVLPIMYGMQSHVCTARGCLQLFAAQPASHSYGALSGAVSRASRATQPVVTGCRSFQLFCPPTLPEWRKLWEPLFKRQDHSCCCWEEVMSAAWLNRTQRPLFFFPLSFPPHFCNNFPSCQNRNSFQVQSPFQRSPHRHHLFRGLVTMNPMGPGTELDELPNSYRGHANGLKVSGSGCVGQICKRTETSEDAARHAMGFTKMPNQALASCHCL